jgi:hypothetical protein
MYLYRTTLSDGIKTSSYYVIANDQNEAKQYIDSIKDPAVCILRIYFMGHAISNIAFKAGRKTK